jgi:hypothetical protein
MSKLIDKMQKWIGERNAFTQIVIIMFITFVMVSILMAIGS